MKKICMILIALIAWFALVLQISLSIRSMPVTGFSLFKTVVNFFSYFTILSNLLVALSLSLSLLRPGSYFSGIQVQTAIAVYIFIVGLIYNLVLRNIWNPTGWQLVADNLLHVVVPVLYLAYWIIFTSKKKLHPKNITGWLIFPFLYLAYSLIRGTIANWYPYPFVNAAELGYEKVALNSFFVVMAFLVIGLALIGVNQLDAKTGAKRES